MQIHYGLDNFEAKRPVVTIGTFDGVHLGHREVIAELKRIARETNGESVVFTFFPHPRMVVTPDEDTIRLLTTQEEKCMLLEELKLDRLVIYPFTREFASLTYSEFVKNILVDQMHICKLVTGYDHKFGHDRQGDFHALQILGDQYGFEVEQLNPMLVENVAVSSTKIRQALESGDIKKVSHYLGYPYLLKGKVVEGRRLGREIGFPTANILPDDQHKLIPTDGVYAVLVEVGGTQYKGMLNVGTRPTVNTNVDHRSIEVHIFDFSEDIYQKDISVSFVERIRNEVKFGSLDQLKAQLALDKARTLSIFANLI
ncbi:MAG: bifunctional riboflavin kinase/FAD synthetase [Prolixibacteraceae bacterium]|nr:bifunctional riboflavin kinase/FAD synthetase [Prolixibacteraceae bacterium]